MPPCVLLQATFEDFSNKLYSAPSVNDSKRFSKPKLSRSDFTIDHYAGGWVGEGRELLVSAGLSCRLSGAGQPLAEDACRGRCHTACLPSCLPA